jgi:CIDE-N domain
LDKPVYVVLEEDGTEVDEEEYFQTLPGEEKTRLHVQLKLCDERAFSRFDQFCRTDDDDELADLNNFSRD